MAALTPLERLEAIAPRLARARRLELAEAAAIRRARRRLATDRLRLERLVAHRELQLQRAQAEPRRRRRSSYIAERHTLLEEARAALTRLERRRV